jgi:hypothetical protein
MQVYSAVAKEARNSLVQVRLGAFNGRSGVRVTIADAAKASGDSAALEPLAHRLAAVAWAALPARETYEFVAVGWARNTGPADRAFRYFEYAPPALDPMPPAPPMDDVPLQQPSNRRMDPDGARPSVGFRLAPAAVGS